MSTLEYVALLDNEGEVIGSAAKSEVHNFDTALHLAFSCYLMNAEGQILLTRRALTKQAWPGVWTNSFCGHPSPDENIEAAVQRRARQELGVEFTSLTLMLPHFRYRAIDPSGIVENEICPVFLAMIDGEVTPEASEVMEWVWASPGRVLASTQHTPFVFSPWMREQLPELMKFSKFGGSAAY